MADNREYFSNVFYRSIGSLYTDFYAATELAFLEEELYTIYDTAKEEMIAFSFFNPKEDDPLLRLNVHCLVLTLESLPFFTTLLNKYMSFNGYVITRSLHFHPDDSHELIYLELEKLAEKSLDEGKLKDDLGIVYKKIKKSNTDFHILMDDKEAPWFQIWEEPFNSLVFWLLRRAYLLEGAWFIDRKYDFEKSFGNVDTSGDGYAWFRKLSAIDYNGQDTMMFSLESAEQSFLGDGDYFYIAFIRREEKMFLSGSLNEFARSSGMIDIPVFRERFENFLSAEKIQSRSGLARITRTMFNYIPTEILFLIPEHSYNKIHRSIIEYTFKNNIRSFGVLLEEDLALLIALIPEKNWSEEKWLQAKNRVSETLPGCRVKDYQVFRGRTIEGFLVVRTSLLVSDSLLFELSSNIENSFRNWEDIFKSRWLERNKFHISDAFEFSDDYVATHSPETAVQDMEHIRNLSTNRLFIDVRADNFDNTIIHAVTLKEEYPLSSWVSAIVYAGISPISQKVYRIVYQNQEYTKSEFFFHYFEDTHFLYNRLTEVLYYALDGSLAVDVMLSLVHKTEIDANGIFFLQAMRDYCLQTNSSFHSYEFNSILLEHSEFVWHAWQFFQDRFQKGIHADTSLLKQLADQAKTLVEDRVLKSISSVILALVRTDFFGNRENHRDMGILKKDIAYKFDSSIPESLPEPRPWREIFVYSSDFQGIHLRGGPVARGGIRYSDRNADYRTEILALMKTQMVKNTLIVPVGSKGGFVITGNLYKKEKTGLKDAYIRYISALLAVTDNRDGKKLLPFADSQGPFAWDGEDSYLVVAADKGTAQLSDIANRISVNSGFWLGDAFASGGSAGYSHKAFGITAKGALITAERRFRSLEVDFRKQPVTVIGIGDMGGDVFGNGLLESKYFKLLGAFNHKFIFIDPNPDPEISFSERKRLFLSEKSDWDSYNLALISSGGGVYSRNEKSISISPIVQKMLGTDQSILSGPELVSALLKAPVDMLYNGGIGTYIKASWEENSTVGDLANNDVRINGNEVKAKVVCEGGNLGLTQEGRIEYSLHGGDIFTDAIDNSGGVDLSDHEVNLKIFFHFVKDENGQKPDRDELLKEIADEVIESVLQNNRYQSLAVNTDEYESGVLGWKPFEETVEYLESLKILDTVTEHLTGWKKWQERKNVIPKPVLCVLLGYAKMELYREVVSSGILHANDFSELYLSYFPKTIQKTFGNELFRHPLAKEIMATIAVNFYINFTGAAGLLLFKDGSEAEKMERFQHVLSALYKENIHTLLLELSNINDIQAEKSLYRLVSDLREIVRTRWKSVLSSTILSNHPAAAFLSGNSKEVLFKFAGST